MTKRKTGDDTEMLDARKAQESDMLRSIFSMQTTLNDYVFKKNGLRDNEGNPLTMQTLVKEIENGHFSVNDVPNQWLSRYTTAIEEELIELKQDLLWKWWSKDQINLQNIRVELVDILHFLVSAMLAAGLTADKLHDIYRQKHAANLARQDAGYNRETKNEDDNRGIR
jgi:dimeric dUTPase (all-alpha-NTP-PPase superfamily)